MYIGAPQKRSIFTQTIDSPVLGVTIMQQLVHISYYDDGGRARLTESIPTTTFCRTRMIGLCGPLRRQALVSSEGRLAALPSRLPVQ